MPPTSALSNALAHIMKLYGFPAQWLNCPLWLGKEGMSDDERRPDKQWRMFLCTWRPPVKACAARKLVRDSWESYLSSRDESGMDLEITSGQQLYQSESRCQGSSWLSATFTGKQRCFYYSQLLDQFLLSFPKAPFDCFYLVGFTSTTALPSGRSRSHRFHKKNRLFVLFGPSLVATKQNCGQRLLRDQLLEELKKNLRLKGELL